LTGSRRTGRNSPLLGNHLERNTHYEIHITNHTNHRPPCWRNLSFSERATVISIDDEAAGEFITVKQQMDYSSQMDQTVTFDPEEWDEVKGVIDQIFKDIKDYQDEKP
jgi:hypothetical protein